MSNTILPVNRRTFLAGAAIAAVGSSLKARSAREGEIVGEPMAAKVGGEILADGGNAFDAIVAGALAAAMSSPYQFGLGGYGGSAVFAVAGGRIASLDFNTSAPAAAKADLFLPVEGKPATNKHGWLAAGVPGILAGLQHLLEKYTSRPLADLAKPAIALARDGIPVAGTLLNSVKASAAQFAVDPASSKLYLRDGKPIPVGERFCNPDLAALLATFAQRGSFDSFYRGDIAGQAADGFRRNGGLVTVKDLAAYAVRESAPLTMRWGGREIHTAPLTSGGLTILQALRVLEAMQWAKLPEGTTRTQARVEALRVAWRDRLTLLGDPEKVRVPVTKLLSAEYAGECAAGILTAMKAGKIPHHAVAPREQGGTISLAAADDKGNWIAMTLTHGDTFGARVTLPGLGMTLGHGMSRFEVRPDHPNAPGPGKRPLHNMCPTLVTVDGKPILALGARGGRKIPNAVFEVLLRSVVLEMPLQEALAAPRLHTEGDITVELEKHWPESESAALAKLGYTVKVGSAATVSSVARETHGFAAGMR